MEPSDARQRFLTLFSTIGERALNVLYPNDFEYYVLSFELVNSRGTVEEYFVFPIMPESYMEAENTLTNIEKSLGGIITTETNTFVPRPITLKGNFGGRKFKFLLGNSNIDFLAIDFSKRGVLNTLAKVQNAVFDSSIKTGYGVTKIWERILEKSKQLDDFGGSRSLYMYNPALGNNYLVEVLYKEFRQDVDQNNMIWNYLVNLMAVAPLEQIQGLNLRNSNVKNLVYSAVNDGVTKVIGNVRRSIGI